jgi:hypothetical protein
LSEESFDVESVESQIWVSEVPLNPCGPLASTKGSARFEIFALGLNKGLQFCFGGAQKVTALIGGCLGAHKGL